MKLSEEIVGCIIRPMLERNLAYCGDDLLRKRVVPSIYLAMQWIPNMFWGVICDVFVIWCGRRGMVNSEDGCCLLKCVCDAAG
jgi:hypothetical protein